MLNKNVNPVLSKKIILIILISICFSILVADISSPEAPVKIEISVSKDKVYVGDSIDVQSTITLLKDHPNYEKGKEYRVVEKTNYVRLPSGKLHRKSKPLWEVLYSDSSKIINDENPEVNFHYRIKLAKRPDYKEIPIMSVVVCEIGEDNAEYKSKSIIIECLNEGLKERPEFLKRKYHGGIIIPDKPLKLSPEIRPKVYDFRRKIKVNPEDLIRIVKVDEDFLNKYKGKQGFHVLINSTIEWIFPSDVSNVSCDPSIGYAYQSGPNLITLESASTVGATGDIYFTMDGTNYSMPIELVGNYDIEGSFKYEKTGNDDYNNAEGEALLLDYEDPSNPSIIDQQALINGSFSFNDVTYPIVGILLLLNNSECEIIEGNPDALYAKGRGLIFHHLEYPDDNKVINITFTFDYDAYNWDDYDFWLEDKDMAKAHNVFDQAIRAENFSTNSLYNAPRSKIFIYSWLYHIGFEDGSFFFPDAITIGPDTFDFIYIDGWHFWDDDTDQMDNSIILHELGHAYHWEFAEFKGSSHSGQQHYWNQAYDDSLAWYEGFATFFSCLVKHQTEDATGLNLLHGMVSGLVI